MRIKLENADKKRHPEVATRPSSVLVRQYDAHLGASPSAYIPLDGTIVTDGWHEHYISFLFLFSLWEAHTQTL